MRSGLIVLAILFGASTSAFGQVSVGVDFPGVNIGINLSTYPELVRVPGYPVYYAPQVNSNYFFYDGLYWVFQNDNWYTSTWYDGPWELMDPDAVPLFLLRVPVRYYREPPAYFRGWVSNAPPRWGEHWGNGWADHHRGWDQWNRKAAPAPAPLPVYQRQYSGNRYPRPAQQQALQTQNYRYQPRDAVVRQHYSAIQRAQNQSATSPQARQPTPQASGAPQNTPQASSAPQNARTISRPPAAERAARPPRNAGENAQNSAGAAAQGSTAARPTQRPPQAAAQRPPRDVAQPQTSAPRAPQGDAQGAPQAATQRASQAAAQRPPQAATERPPRAAAQQPPHAAAARAPQAAARPPQAAEQRPPQAKAPVAPSEGRAAPAKGPAREPAKGQKDEPGNGKQRNEDRDK